MSEKSWQVGQMLSIYTAASQVLVWLGPASDGSDAAMDKLCEVGNHVLLGGCLKDSNSFKYVMSLNEERMNVICEHFFAPAFEFFYEAVALTWSTDAIARLLSRSWWSRVW